MGVSDQPELRKKRQANIKKKGREQIYSAKHVRIIEQIQNKNLVTESDTSHTTFKTQNVVVKGV